MNWPPLTSECSNAIADAIRDAVEKKPKDLFEHVAQLLQDRSGKDPTEFEEYFKTCREQPRTYVLEDRCPAGQDPLSWVPMRYNDDTILLSLQQKSMDFVGDIISQEPIENTKGLYDSAIVTYPELMYMRDSPEELLAFQTVKAIYLVCSPYKDVLTSGLDDPDQRLCFRCESLCTGARSSQVFEAVVSLGETAVEALIVCCLLRVLGRHDGFRNRYGAGHNKPDLAILHAIETEAEALPSYQRLGDWCKQLVVATFKANFPLETLLASEAVPAQFARAKEALGPLQGGLQFFVAVLVAEHLVVCRNTMVTDDVVDIVRLGVQALNAIEKYGAPRSYELFLKKRAERHQWRLMKDDLALRAIIRLCCLAGMEDTDSWQMMQSVVHGLDPSSKETLTTELGRKDGITDLPVFMLVGGGAMMSRASANHQLEPQQGVLLLVKILAAASKTFEKSLSNKVIRLHLANAATLAKDFRPGGVPFEETPFVFEDAGAGEVMVRIAGIE